MHILNPAVLAAAESFTDGSVHHQLLRDVAVMKHLPLYVPRVITAPCAEEQAHATIAATVARVTRVRRDYVAARARFSAANRRQPHLTAEARRRASRSARADAMRSLNRARIACLHAERAEADARAALAALSSPIALPLAA